MCGLSMASFPQKDASGLASGDISTILSQHPKLFPPDSPITKDLSDLIDRLKDKPKALWDIADYDEPVADPTHIDPTTGKPMKAGKALLLVEDDFGWNGKADLNDKLTVDRWREYSKKGRKISLRGDAK